jgi:Sec-independent protein secretion pathway component TatC
MWFGIGFWELVLVGSAVVLTALLGVFRLRGWRFAAVLSVCLAIATILTPADPLSALAVGLILFLTFAIGVYSSTIVRPRPPTA